MRVKIGLAQINVECTCGRKFVACVKAGQKTFWCSCGLKWYVGVIVRPAEEKVKRDLL